MKFILDIYSHYVKVTGHDRSGKDTLVDFCTPYTEFGIKPGRFGKMRRYKLRTFAAATADRREFRFHINQLPELLRRLNDTVIDHNQIVINNHTPPKAVEVNHKLRRKWVARDYQVPIIDYLCNDHSINVLPIQTGKGKTSITLAALSRIKERAVLIIEGGLVEQWVKAYKEVMIATNQDIMTVRGSKQLADLIRCAQDGTLKAKFIIITNKTIFNYLKYYEVTNGAGSDYPVKADKLWETIGAGVRIIDEAHSFLHLNFRIDLYTNIKKTISLSATIDSEHQFKNSIYRICYPHEMRYKGLEYDKYVAVKALFYNIPGMEYMRYTARGRGSYSHMEFEKSLMALPKIRDSYFKLVDYVLDSEYFKSCESGMKLLVLFSTQALCTLFTERLSKTHPTLRVERYIHEDSYTEMLKGDIIVSTPQSCGKAIDIPNLYVVLLTPAINSKEFNEQVKGRLRRLVDFPDTTPKFLYFVCMDIDKHITYHRDKKMFFSGKVLSHQELQLPHF